MLCIRCGMYQFLDRNQPHDLWLIIYRNPGRNGGYTFFEIDPAEDSNVLSSENSIIIRGHTLGLCPKCRCNSDTINSMTLRRNSTEE